MLCLTQVDKPGWEYFITNLWSNPQISSNVKHHLLLPLLVSVGSNSWGTLIFLLKTSFGKHPDDGLPLPVTAGKSHCWFQFSKKKSRNYVGITDQLFPRTKSRWPVPMVQPCWTLIHLWLLYKGLRLGGICIFLIFHPLNNFLDATIIFSLQLSRQWSLSTCYY